MTEYALLLVFIFLVAIFGLQLFGTSVTALFSKFSSALANAPNGAEHS